MVKRKPLEEILKMLQPYRKVLLLACDGCVGIYDVGGLKQAEVLKLELQMAWKAKGLKPAKIETATVLRQCDTQIVKDLLSMTVKPFDAVLSLACGTGVQTMAHVFTEKPALPANDTMFITMEDKGEKVWNEWCSACGSCVLHETDGICPVTRCAKSLLNGPCGGQSGGKCEVGGWKNDCAWVLIYNRLKERGKLDLFTVFRMPKDFRQVQHPRQLPIAEAKAE
ncbi:MAG: methylenetetrahydrofolate reductase C-terminal domain-containing protein [Candidatus Bathyarchaeia archaeon]